MLRTRIIVGNFPQNWKAGPGGEWGRPAKFPGEAFYVARTNPWGGPPLERIIATSREGRPLFGHQLGHGPLRVSLIAGCHGDEPMGPQVLRGLLEDLSRPDHPWLARATFRIVPDANPDAAARNASWWDARVGADLPSYLLDRVRELPGDDLEFGFPGGPDGDDKIRPEAAGIAAFLREGGAVDLHGSLHGLGFAEGPWFLVEPAWEDRLEPYRQACWQVVRELGLRVHDRDRRGEKGFRRISEGFCTRPDSVAMRAHFEALGDLATAALFRPSSMEFARSLGGDPFTFVTEVPLFLLPEGWDEGSGQERIARWILDLTKARRAGSGDEASALVRAQAEAAGIARLDPGVQERVIHAQVAAALDLVEASRR